LICPGSSQIKDKERDFLVKDFGVVAWQQRIVFPLELTSSSKTKIKSNKNNLREKCSRSKINTKHVKCTQKFKINREIKKPKKTNVENKILSEDKGNK